MVLNFDWGLFQQAQAAKNRNQQEMNQNIASLGQNLGQGFNTIGQAMQEQKKKELVQQIVAAMNGQGAPQQGPQPEGMTGAPMSGMGAPAQDNTQLINSLTTQYDPQGAINAMRKKMEQKPTSPWRVVPAMLSPEGNPIQQNEMSGEVRTVPLKITPTGRGNSAFGTGSIDWNSASDQDRNVAKALYEGRIRPGDLGYRDKSVGVKLAEQYARMNNLEPYKAYAGNVAGETAKAFASGKFGQNALSLNTALGHVNSAYNAFQKVGNTNQEWLNVPLNTLRAKTNDPNVVALNTTLTALRGELANVFKSSGGTDQEISQWMGTLNSNLTPTQFGAVIPQIDDLLRSRLSALDYQRQSGMSGRGEQPLLSPHASAISNKFGSEKKVVEDGYVYTPGPGGKGNKDNWKKK